MRSCILQYWEEGWVSVTSALSFPRFVVVELPISNLALCFYGGNRQTSFLDRIIPLIHVQCAMRGKDGFIAQEP